MKDILTGESNDELNVHSRSRDARARLLSALANRPFEINGQMFSSVEGFFQGIRFEPGDPRRLRAFASSFGYARNFKDEAGKDNVWWNDKKITSGSREHKELIEIAFRASIAQNPDRKEALINTKGLRLTHDIGEEDEPNSPFTSEEFCILLSKIRDEILVE